MHLNRITKMYIPTLQRPHIIKSSYIHTTILITDFVSKCFVVYSNYVPFDHYIFAIEIEKRLRATVVKVCANRKKTTD